MGGGGVGWRWELCGMNGQADIIVHRSPRHAPPRPWEAGLSGMGHISVLKDVYKKEASHEQTDRRWLLAYTWNQ